MKFDIKIFKKYGGRIGELCGLNFNPEIIYETPLILINTKSGSVPHLSQDVFHRNFTKECLLTVPAQHFAEYTAVLQAYEKGVTSFAALSTHPVFVSVQDALDETPTGYNDSLSISLWGSSGRMKLTPKSYFELMQTMKPDWYEALSDCDTDVNSSRKRVEKSIKLSFQFIKESRAFHAAIKNGACIFCPLLGGINPTDRSKWSQAIHNENFDGYCISGLHNNGATAQNLTPDLVEKCVKASLSNIDGAKPIQAMGAYSIIVILTMIECGVDIFDSSNSLLAAECGFAAIFPNTLELIRQELSKSFKIHSKNSEALINTESNSSNLDNEPKKETKDYLPQNGKKAMKCDLGMETCDGNNKKCDLSVEKSNKNNQKCDCRIENEEKCDFKNYNSEKCNSESGSEKNEGNCFIKCDENEEKFRDNLNKNESPAVENKQEFDRKKRKDKNASKTPKNDPNKKAKFLRRPYEIDLNDIAYKDSKDPLCKNCNCYTCTNYSRAYLHHLLSVREMLASILLVIHNLHHWNEFFKTVRESIKFDHFSEIKTFFK